MKEGEILAQYMSDAALTYTLPQFIQMRYSDEMTYHNFSIVEKINGLELLDHNLIEDYLPELEALCVNCELDNDQYKRYRYSPDLLAYDVYGSTQLDFVILFANGMIDPKEFNLKKVKLPYRSQMSTFLSAVYNANQVYISQNWSDNGLQVII